MYLKLHSYINGLIIHVPPVANQPKKYLFWRKKSLSREVFNRRDLTLLSSGFIALAFEERSGSVVNCLTRERRVAGSSLTEKLLTGA